MTTLHENIRKFRELRRMTQKQFADRLNKSRNVISNWERGANSPDPDTIEQICKILNVTPNQIFGWEKCPDYEIYLKRIEHYKESLHELQKQRDAINLKIEEVRDSIRKETVMDEEKK